MKEPYQHIVSLILAVVVMINCVLSVTALTPEFGEIELKEPPYGVVALPYPNLLEGTDEAQRARIWSYLKVENSPENQTMTIPAGIGAQRMNLLCLQTDTTYVLSGRVKGGKPDLYFEPGRILHVNSSTTGRKYVKVSETEWTSFSYVFTTDVKRPSGGDYYWLAFGNSTGETASYWDSLSIQQLTMGQLALSDFTWNDGQNPTTAKKGDLFRGFSIKVTNTGTTDIPRGEGFAVDVCIDATTQVATMPWYRGLAAGESVTLTNKDAEWIAVDGDHALTAYLRTDVAYHTYERTQHTEDNQIFRNVRVADEDLVAPDLASEFGFTELTFSDEFNSLNSIDLDATGKAGYKWYVTRPYGEKVQVEGRDFSVENGVLTIHTDETRWAYSLATIDIRKMVGFAFNKGYLECRIRMPIRGDEGWDSTDTWKDDPNNGTVRNPGIWAYPTKTLWASAMGVRNVSSVEMDWMEYHGTKYLATFGTTLHERRSELVEVTDENGVVTQEWKQTWHTTSANNAYDEIGSEHAGDASSAEGYHLLSCVWDEGFVRMYVDNELKFTIGYQENDYPSSRSSEYDQKPQIGSMTEMNEQFLPIILGASEEFQMEVDYVRVWQKPVDFVPEQKAFTLSDQLLTLSLKDRTYLRATDEAGNMVHHLHWQSSNPSVVSVYNDGLLVAIGKGTAVVQATDMYGNTQLCTVIVDQYGNLIQEGDFEGRLEYTMFSKFFFDGKTKTSIATLATQTGNTFMQIPTQSTETFQYLNGVPLKAGKTYSFSFRYKGNPTVRVYDQNNYIVDDAYDSQGTYGFKYELPYAYSWKTVTKIFKVEDTVANSGNLSSATLGFANTGWVTAAIDDITVVEIMPDSTVTVAETPGGTVTIDAGKGVSPGEKIAVTVIPEAGYLLKSGSLTYTTQDGSTYAILNLESGSGDGLYAGSGQTFAFYAPVGATTVHATFVPSTQNNYQFGTIGTAVRRGDGVITGVRFLNRLYIENLDVSGESLFVVHNGKRLAVNKIGALMTVGEVDSLTLADYEDFRNGTSDQRVWHGISYDVASSSLSVTAYTDSYLDCQISMAFSKTANLELLNRTYAACGYLELEDGTVIYTAPRYTSAVDTMALEAECYN